MRWLSVLFSVGLPIYLALASTPSYAGYEWGFADMSLNRLFWSPATERKSTKTDFNYLELEGGGQFTWGELYGFFDLENVAENGSVVRTAGKGVLRYYLGNSHFSIYAQVYNFSANAFNDQTRVLGLGYQITGPGWWVKPFLGADDVTQTFFNGMNGYMAGLVAGYSFKIAKEDFQVTDWHEFEFAHKPSYASTYKGNTTGQNGALGLWWNAIPQFTLGLQWRYAVDKLGTPGYSGATIVSLRYNF